MAVNLTTLVNDRFKLESSVHDIFVHPHLKDYSIALDNLLHCDVECLIDAEAEAAVDELSDDEVDRLLNELSIENET